MPEKTKKLLIWGSLATILAGFLFVWYLVSDDPQVNYITDISHYAPQPENGEETFGKLMNLSEKGAEIELSLKCWNFEDTLEEYMHYLSEKEEYIRQKYDELQPLIPLLEELATFESIGDTNNRYDSPTLNFSGIRHITLIITAKVELALIDEPDSEAMQNLIQVLHILNAWRPHTRSLTHTMIPIAIYRKILTTVERTHGLYTGGELHQLERELEEISCLTEAIDRSLMVEFCMYCALLDSICAEASMSLDRILINKKRTQNLFGDIASKTIELNKQQRTGDIETSSSSFEKEFRKFRLKNRIGWALLAMSVPAWSKVYEVARNTEVQKDELLERISSLY